MSSERSLRLRSPASSSRRSNRRFSRPSSPSPLRGSPTSSPRKRPILSAPIDILPKCSSEPQLPGGSHGSPIFISDDWFSRQMTFTDVISPPSTLLSPDRPQSPKEVYQKDTKVVITVTMEGSPGPIRIMVKLGATVEETIKLVIEKFEKEGRIPRQDKNASSLYELHLSSFSLESLKRSDSIGEVRSRNFYLRKGKSSLETSVKASNAAATESSSLNHSRLWPPMIFLPTYITRKTSKIARRMRRVWKILGCIHCSS